MYKILQYIECELNNSESVDLFVRGLLGWLLLDNGSAFGGPRKYRYLNWIYI
jgi:hypothetical protein